MTKKKDEATVVAGDVTEIKVENKDKPNVSTPDFQESEEIEDTLNQTIDSDEIEDNPVKEDIDGKHCTECGKVIPQRKFKYLVDGDKPICGENCLKKFAVKQASKR